jgi:DNA-binding transcriptional LysR family regulator
LCVSDISLDLSHLRLLEALLEHRSITRAAAVIGVTQPGASKALERLRRYFNDPLFVRTGSRMEPTQKALDLQAQSAAIIERLHLLSPAKVVFDPRSSERTFTFCVVDAGAIILLPRLVSRLATEAPNVHVRVVEVDLSELEDRLIEGAIDFAMGSFPGLSKAIRRQHLWTETYAAVVRDDHPRIADALTLDQFVREKHVVVSALGMGHAHQRAERAIENAVSAKNIICRVPAFSSAALLAKYTDAIAVLPRSTAIALAQDIGLTVLAPPLKLPELEIYHYWHGLMHREPGRQWIRALFIELFATAQRQVRPAGTRA